MKIPNEFNPLGINNTGMPTKGLDFYCPYDQDLNDVVNGISGTGSNYFKLATDNDSTIGKCVVGTLTTKSNSNCLNYNGTADMFQYGTGDFSLSFWLQAPKWNDYSNDNVFLSKKTSNSTSGFLIFRRGGVGDNSRDLTMRLDGTTAFYTNSPANSIYWIHWAFIRKDGVGYWYKNGTLVNYANLAGSANSSEILRIGWNNQFSSCGYYNFKALRIYNRALNQKQITLLSTEFDIYYYLKANNQTFEFYPYPSVQTLNINFTFFGVERPFNANYQIVEGSLPNGIELGGSGVLVGKTTDTSKDTTTQVKIRISYNNIKTIPVEFIATIIQHKETVLTVTSPQTFNFISESFQADRIACNTGGLKPTITLSDTLPAEISLFISNSDPGYVSLQSTGNQSSAESKTITATFTTEYHPTPVTATLNINNILNQISTTPNVSAKFYTEDGVQTYKISYTSQKTITPVYTLTGTLPNGITFDSATGTFTYDGTTTIADTATVTVVISSSTGHSATATATVTLNIIVGTKGNLILQVPMETDFSAEGGSRYNTPSNWIISSVANKACALNNTGGTPGLFYNVDTPITGSNPFTMSVWLYYTSLSSNKGIFYIGKSVYNQAFGFQVTTTSGDLSTAWGTWSYDVNPSIGNHANEWIMFTATYSEDKYIRVYLNGQLISTSTSTVNLDIQKSTGGFSGNYGDVAIGSRWADNRPWQYYMRDFRMYSTALSAAEIATLYSEG